MATQKTTGIRKPQVAGKTKAKAKEKEKDGAVAVQDPQQVIVQGEGENENPVEAGTNNEQLVEDNVNVENQEPQNPSDSDENKGETDRKDAGSEISDEEWDKGKRDGFIEENEDENEGVQLKLKDDGDIAEEEKKEGSNPMLKDIEKKEEIVPFSRKTKLEYSSSNVSIKSLFKEWKKDQLIKANREQEVEQAIKDGKPIPEWEDETTLRFDLAIQRNEAWSDYQKSDLIHTILYGYYVFPVLVQDSNDGKKWFLDGKQRITTLMTYINGEWALSKKTKTVYGHKIATMKFKDLTEEMQDEILDRTITLVRMKNMTEPERDEMFVKQNSGSPLTRIELTRAMHSELISSINQLSKIPFFKDDVELSKKARDRFVDQEIILQIAMLFEEGKEKIKGFGAGHIQEYVLRLKEAEKTISDELMQRFEDDATYLTLAFEEYEMDDIKKALKKIHVPIIFYVAETAIKENLQPKLFGDFIRSFLISNYSVESKYGKSCQSGSSKKENVLTRLDEMSASLESFLKMVKEAATMEEGVKAFDKHLADINGIERQMDTDDIE
ncbi:DUF262 domain-containing protein [Paenibacillus alvei]|uniref:DUF262 domain-containing protein n=1 Tax=Paenibacillus alvei TaxID=44250 RepID=UPI0002892C75|nr:DUF262 domain-containing protein [Paenibacillus alvei]EJW14084.1 hypothetical protein PAV_141p01900 [Paenibacillus alvei DSM 29]MCY9707766.1 DUF262 domain-containing protein [Paenibacillus alvei]MCY9757747.1 DUF262 domain-containing protein [Paenibacillus alvei]MEC0082721.1 DUF262 domain-containing protein [Paenibacillus alvei]